MPKPVGSTARASFFSTITILRICICFSLSVNHLQNVMLTHKRPCFIKWFVTRNRIFWTKSGLSLRRLEMWPNAVLTIWTLFTIKTKTRGKQWNKMENKLNANQKHIKHRSKFDFFTSEDLFCMINSLTKKLHCRPNKWNKFYKIGFHLGKISYVNKLHL